MKAVPCLTGLANLSLGNCHNLVDIWDPTIKLSLDQPYPYLLFTHSPIMRAFFSALKKANCGSSSALCIKKSIYHSMNPSSSLLSLPFDLCLMRILKCKEKAALIQWICNISLSMYQYHLINSTLALFLLYLSRQICTRCERHRRRGGEWRATQTVHALQESGFVRRSRSPLSSQGGSDYVG